jgi:curved DNA-binding protein CbpA
MDYYAVLGLNRNASSSQVKDAYLRLVRENHPDRFPDPDQRERAQARFKEITEAYNALKDDQQRADYDRSLTVQSMSPEEQAELYYRNGSSREKVKQYQEALQLFHEALRLRPDHGPYLVAVGRTLARDPTKARLAAEHFEKAIASDPTEKEPYLELGALLVRSGLAVRARRIFEAGLEQHPGDRELLELLARVGRGRDR